jgi:hypothetical protein
VQPDSRDRPVRCLLVRARGRWDVGYENRKDRTVGNQTPERQLGAFLAKYSPAIRSLAEASLNEMRARLPGAVELVHDNYNALAITFGSSERRADVIFSVTVYPRWVSLFFTGGASLPNPEKLLKGSGKSIRHVVLEDASVLDRPAVRKLMAAALAQAERPIDPSARRRLVIQSVSAKQRPRRPPSSGR